MCVMRCLNSEVSIVPLPSLSRVRKASRTYLIMIRFVIKINIHKNHDHYNDHDLHHRHHSSYHFSVILLAHFIAHHVAKLRKLNLPRAVCVVLGNCIIIIRSTNFLTFNSFDVSIKSSSKMSVFVPSLVVYIPMKSEPYTTEVVHIIPVKLYPSENGTV